VRQANEVYLSIQLENELASVTRHRLPYESCGVIYGYEEEGIVYADGFNLVRNVSSSPADSFSFHPEDWISVYYKAQRNQRNIVGLFHSHPRGAPIPSFSDVQGFIPWGTYWIISFDQSIHNLAVFRRDIQGRWHTLPMKRE